MSKSSIPPEKTDTHSLTFFNLHFLENSMKKFLAVFMAALMMVAVLAAPLKAAHSVGIEYNNNTTSTQHICISDADLMSIEGGTDRRYDACYAAGAVAAVGIATGGLTFGISLIVSAYLLAEPCARAAFGH